MCGIAGYISRENISHNVLNQMTNAIAHRGPDGSGVYYDDMRNIGLGHRRLSIVDLSDAGHQPMNYLDRYTITYNGEVYNHLEIREELEKKGYVFKSHTDTEVILASYDFWGAECLKKFNGMWAFVIYDQRDDVFFISRDRFGIKPLYFYQSSNLFIFSSEVKSIYASGLVDNQPNKNYIDDYLKNGPKDYLEQTAFKNVYRFPKSSYFLGRREELFKKLNTELFWELSVNVQREKFSEEKAKEYADKYLELLQDSVRLRLRADVKVGSALSGGLDSSSIVYLVNQELRSKGKEELQETFSSVYKSDGTQHCDESEFIDLIARQLNVTSNQIEPQVEDIPSEYEKMIWMMENPPESTCMSGWHTFKKVKESDVTVTLDGQGADEQLAGYLYYVPTYLLSIHALDFYKEIFLFLKIPGVKKQVLLAFILFHMRAVLGIKLTKRIFKAVMKRSFEDELNIQLQHSVNTSLVTLINYSDHVSMGNSIESRMPFMDYRLVEFLASVPACYKMHNGWTKYLARLAFSSKIPNEICWRKDKMGWPIPEKYWFTGPLSHWFESRIDKKLCAKYNISAPRFTNNSHTKKSVRALNVMTFYKLFFNSKG